MAQLVEGREILQRAYFTPNLNVATMVNVLEHLTHSGELLSIFWSENVIFSARLGSHARQSCSMFWVFLFFCELVIKSINFLLRKWQLDVQFTYFSPEADAIDISQIWNNSHFRDMEKNEENALLLTYIFFYIHAKIASSLTVMAGLHAFSRDIHIKRIPFDATVVV